MTQRSRRKVRLGSDYSTKRRLLLIGLLALCGFGRPVAAQSIRVTEPAPWMNGRLLTVAFGDSVRVIGTVNHPGGVRHVLVNGRQVAVRAAPDFPGLFDFDHVIVVDSALREFSIAVVPPTGEPFAQRYAIEVTGVPAPRPTVPPVTVVDPPVREARPDSVRQPIPLSNPWKPFRVRGLLYAVAAGAGVGLSMMEKTDSAEVCQAGDCVIRRETKASYQSIGLGLAGVGVAGLIVDALMTSRRAKAITNGSQSIGNRGEFYIDVLKPIGYGTARWQLFQVQYRYH
jgi:hypothetical protein